MKIIDWLFTTTRRDERDWKAATIVGLVAGGISFFAKWGGEHMVPPRFADTLPPPAIIAQDWFHMPATMYTWMGTPIGTAAIIHAIMSIILLMIYIYLAEIFPRVRLWQGVAYGICAAIGAHFIAIPAMGLSGWPWELPWQASVSELVSHAITFFIAEQAACGVRAKLTGKPYPRW